MFVSLDTQQNILFADVVPVLLFSFSIVINRYLSHRHGSWSQVDPTTISDAKRLKTGEENASSKELFYYDEHYSLPSHLTRELRKEERRIAKMPLLAMKSPMYDNCDLLDPDGNLLAKVSMRKAQWYIAKGLGDWTSDEENKILLNFEPKSRSSQSYGVSKKENICVICGRGENYIRFYIVPYVYRTLFPICFKSHMSHDIVIVCGFCHMHCEKYTQTRMRELEAMCRPHNGYPPKYIQNHHLYHVRSCAVALKQWRHKIPDDKMKDYECVVTTYIQSTSQYTKMTNLSPEDLELAAKVEYQVENPNYIPPSDFVVKKLASTDDQIQVFVQEWRQYFIDMNLPKYLPIGWQVDFPARCDNK